MSSTLGPERLEPGRYRRSWWRASAALVALVTVSGCRVGAGDCTHPGGAAWDEICAELDRSALGGSVVVLGDLEGRQLTWRAGATEDTVFRLASASKWLAGVTLLRRVERGALQLDTRPTDVLDWEEPDDDRASVRLSDLLSFTSGFNVPAIETTCADDPLTTVEGCAKAFWEDRHQTPPGEVFVYGPAHLQIAGAMAEATSGRGFAELFRDEVGDPLGLSDATGYFDPSAHNPRLSAGARASVADMELFLRALLEGELLHDDTLAAMLEDRTPAGVELRDSPADDFFGFRWHYGFAAWRECPRRSWTDDCDDRRLVSSVGAFGFFPWIDFDRGLYGVIGRDDGLVLQNDGVPEQSGGHSVRLAVRRLRPMLQTALGVE